MTIKVKYVCCACKGMSDCTLELNEVKRPPQYCPFNRGQTDWDLKTQDPIGGLNDLFGDN